MTDLIFLVCFLHAVDGFASRPRHLTRCNSQSIHPHRNVYHKNDIVENGYDHWTPGDVESDLQELRMAVKKSRARLDLEQRDRLALLDEFAKQRRAILPDLKEFIFRPILLIISIVAIKMLSYSTGFSPTFRTMHIHGSDIISMPLNLVSQTMNRLCDACILFTNLHFWSITTFTPILLFMYSRQKKKVNNKIIENQHDDESKVSQHHMNWGQLLSLEEVNPGEKPVTEVARNECDDYNLCLLENWSFCTFPTCLIGCLTVICTLLHHFRLSSFVAMKITVTFGYQLIMYLSQCIVRLGAVASLHQYPRLLYELKYSNQEKNGPVDFIPKIMYKIIYHGMIKMLPWMSALDISQCIIFGATGFINKRTISNSSSKMLNYFIGSGIVHSSIKLLLVLSTVISITNLVAVKKLFRIQYFTSISLSTSYDGATRLLQKEFNGDVLKNEGTYQWRYKLYWREPRRLATCLQNLRRDFIIFFFKGWGSTDIKGCAESLHSDMVITDMVITSTEKGKKTPKILQLIGDDMRNDSNLLFDRKTWISKSTFKMASIHEENFRQKQYDDPLGLAVYRTLGIGLSFDFDHDSRLKRGQTPSIHRLRARAAKSIVKYCNHSSKPVSEDEKHKFAIDLLSLTPINAPAPEGKDVTIETLNAHTVRKLPQSIMGQTEKKDDEKEYFA